MSNVEQAKAILFEMVVPVGASHENPEYDLSIKLIPFLERLDILAEAMTEAEQAEVGAYAEYLDELYGL